MTHDRSLRLLFAMLVVAQVGTALAGIGFLERMAPAIGRILTDNVASVHAAETMLSILVTPPANDQLADERRVRFYDALDAAEENVTEEAERESLVAIRRHADDALGGEVSAREDVAGALVALSETNQGAMGRANEEALRLGLAGRWALAFLAIFGLVGSVVTIRRARRTLLAPLAEIGSVLEAFRAGVSHRRCFVGRTDELREVLGTINALLDRAERPLATGVREDGPRVRALVAALLDRDSAPLVVIDARGGVFAANREALDHIADQEHSVADAIERGGPVDDVAGTDLRIVRL